ncbi:MAG: protein-glutamate O-methyltransferase CheR [Pseudomonadota bacterium]
MELSDGNLREIAAIAHEAAGLAIAPSKKAMVASRLSKRLARLGVSSFDDYLTLISRSDSSERRRMVAALTTNVSHFFREPHHFDALREVVLPPLIEKARAGERVRLWSAGCANGQEAYSIALVMLELEPEAACFDIRILGTDIDPSVVRFAQLGTYHSSMMENVQRDLAERYFQRDTPTDTWNARAQLLELTLFRELNLHEPWPMPGHFDVIFCRNVVIYFDKEGQKSLWARFQQKLTDRGWLFIGHSERVHGEASQGLELCEHTIYRRR